MGRAYSVERCRGGLWAAAALLAAATALAGCSSMGGSTDWFPSMPGFSSVRGTETDRSAMAAAPETPLMDVDKDCPTVDIRQGASTLSVATKVQQATAGDLRYQLSFTQLARQCALAGPLLRMRIGVQGRVIVGPAGAPSQVEAPVRYAVVIEGVEPKTVATKFRRVPVAIPPGSNHVTFTDVEEDLSFPVPSPAAIDAYVVYVGFDEIGDRNERRPPAKKAAPKAKKSN
jgi:hypothetical protein